VFKPFEPFRWALAHGRHLELGPHGVLMAIVNVTPDSFSDGGRFDSADAAVVRAIRCLEEGAAIIDIGGESTRPGAAPVSAEEEQERILPVIEALAGTTDAIISVDTYRAETARLAIAAGAHIVNDVHGLQREPGIARVAAEAKAGLCIMHTGRDREKRPDVVEDQYLFLGRSLEIAGDAGVPREATVLDPGFGFAKDADENLELMARFGELYGFELPLVAGTSRKRFVGTVTGREDATARDVGTAATTALLRMAGAAVFRVHDVAINRDALLMADAMLVAGHRVDAREAREQAVSDRAVSDRAMPDRIEP
jgi:dihydropteroate synthase